MPLLPDDPQQQKKLMIGVLPLLLLGAYWYFMHGSRAEEVASLETRLETLDTKNATARVKAQQGTGDLEKKLALYEQHITRLEQLVPESEEVSQLLNDITLRAQEHNVELAKITPETEEPGPYYTMQTYRIGVYGAYHDVGRFLTAVGSLPRIITPIEVAMTVRPDLTEEGGPTMLQTEFVIKTYVLPTRRPQPPEASTDART